MWASLRPSVVPARDDHGRGAGMCRPRGSRAIAPRPPHRGCRRTARMCRSWMRPPAVSVTARRTGVERRGSLPHIYEGVMRIPDAPTADEPVAEVAEAFAGRGAAAGHADQRGPQAAAGEGLQVREIRRPHPGGQSVEPRRRRDDPALQAAAVANARALLRRVGKGARLRAVPTTGLSTHSAVGRFGKPSGAAALLRASAIISPILDGGHGRAPPLHKPKLPSGALCPPYAPSAKCAHPHGAQPRPHDIVQPELDHRHRQRSRT